MGKAAETVSSCVNVRAVGRAHPSHSDAQMTKQKKRKPHRSPGPWAIQLLCLGKTSLPSTHCLPCFQGCSRISLCSLLPCQACVGHQLPPLSSAFSLTPNCLLFFAFFFPPVLVGNRKSILCSFEPPACNHSCFCERVFEVASRSYLESQRQGLHLHKTLSMLRPSLSSSPRGDC